MKILFDENTSYRIIKKLKNDFPEAVHVSTLKLMAAKDVTVFEYARQNGYAIVTFDEDYYTLSLLRGFPPKIIWIRTGNIPTNRLAALLVSYKEAIYSFLQDGSEQSYGCLEIS
jgi:predicted nuclease of predicted toxin-antitoxin system